MVSCQLFLASPLALTLYMVNYIKVEDGDRKRRKPWRPLRHVRLVVIGVGCFISLAKSYRQHIYYTDTTSLDPLSHLNNVLWFAIREEFI